MKYEYEMTTPEGVVLRGTVRASNGFTAEMAVYRATGHTAREMFLCRDGATLRWSWWAGRPRTARKGPRSLLTVR